MDSIPTRISGVIGLSGFRPEGIRHEHDRDEAGGHCHPGADIERSKRFYGGLGWRFDADS